MDRGTKGSPAWAPLALDRRTGENSGHGSLPCLRERDCRGGGALFDLRCESGAVFRIAHAGRRPAWYCGRCDHCRRGDFFACVTGQVTGITYDGGYAEYVIAPVSAVARMPAGLDPVEAAPPMCAGLTTFHALRPSGARPGDVVAGLGLGGVGPPGGPEA